MKTRILTLTMLLCALAIGAMGQSLGEYFSPDIESRWTETILRIGDTTCQHSYVDLLKEGNGGFFGSFRITTSCLVLHDERGCPNGWDKADYLCEKCGRRYIRQESREFTQSYHNRQRAARDYQSRIDGAKAKWIEPNVLRIDSIGKRIK